METKTRLEAARKLRLLTQLEAARRAGVSQSFWGAVERGESNPTIDLANRMAQVLGFSAAELWPVETEPEQRTA
jgi:transcriptional regulator with XRE-family HTH domain